MTNEITDQMATVVNAATSNIEKKSAKQALDKSKVSYFLYGIWVSGWQSPGVVGGLLYLPQHPPV